MQGFIADQDERVRDIMEYRQTIDTMKFAIAAQKEAYLNLGKRLDEVSLIGSYGGYQVEILDPPTTPLRPYSPNLYLYLLVGGLCGVAGGVILAFVLDVTDTTFRTPEEVETSLGVPILHSSGFSMIGKTKPEKYTSRPLSQES